MRSIFFGTLLITVCFSINSIAQKVVVDGPKDSARFGTTVKALPNGNFVVVDVSYDHPDSTSNVGAVYLYSSSGTQISKLTGSSPQDLIGNGGIEVLPNGNFLVRSPDWNADCI